MAYSSQGSHTGQLDFCNWLADGYFNCWVSKFLLLLDLQITDEGRTLYIGSFCLMMTSLTRYLVEAAFSISIYSSVFIFLWLFLRYIMDMVSSIIFVSFPSLRTCSENLDLTSAYLWYFKVFKLFVTMQNVISLAAVTGLNDPGDTVKPEMHFH